MATVVKNFRIKSGLVVEGSTGTINGQNILTETGGDSYILNLVGGAALVKSVEATQLEVSGAGKLSVKANVFDAYGAASAAQAAAEATAASDATTKANAAQAAAITAAATDATTKANAAQSAAASDATTKANAAQAAAEATAAAALSTAISTEVSNRNTAISGAVSTLVDGAPDLLNTLNELAAAINDDANYTTTITTALGTKAPLASPALTGTPTAPTAAADTNTTQIATTAFAKAEADAAQAAAEATAASDATTKANAAQAAAEATAAAANTAQQNGTTAFTAINYNSVAKQVAATTGNIVTAAATTALSWVAEDYRSAKLVVKAKNGSHTQVSDLVVTLDTSNNVAVSEYGITYSNGTELAAVTADYSGSDVRIRVTPANNNTEVVVVGTLIK